MPANAGAAFVLSSGILAPATALIPLRASHFESPRCPVSERLKGCNCHGGNNKQTRAALYKAALSSKTGFLKSSF
jgi:hypothetical protein